MYLYTYIPICLYTYKPQKRFPELPSEKEKGRRHARSVYIYQVPNTAAQPFGLHPHPCLATPHPPRTHNVGWARSLPAPNVVAGGRSWALGRGGASGYLRSNKSSFIIPRDFLTRSGPLGGLGDPRKPLGCLLGNPQGSHGGASGNPRSPSAILGDARSAPGEAPRDPRKTLGVPQGQNV